MTAAAKPNPLRNRFALRAIFYAVSFAVLALGGVALLFNHWVDQNFTTPFTNALVVVCGAVINLFGGHVQATGTTLSFVGAGGAVEVSNGCNAVEVSILLIAAILPFPASIPARVFGVIACVGAVQAINLLRIISLLFLARYAPTWFGFFHLYVWDAVIVLDGVLIFFLWTRRYGRIGAS